MAKQEFNLYFRLCLTLMGEEMEKALNDLKFNSKLKTSTIKGFLIASCLELTITYKNNNLDLENLDKITTLNKLYTLIMSLWANDNKVVKKQCKERTNTLHKFAIDNHLTINQEREIINEVIALSDTELNKAKDYGFFCLNSDFELTKKNGDSIRDTYFYQYACVVWLLTDSQKQKKDYEQVKNLSLTDGEKKQVNLFIKKYFNNYYMTLKKANLDKLLSDLDKVNNDGK